MTHMYIYLYARALSETIYMCVSYIGIVFRIFEVGLRGINSLEAGKNGG